MPQIENSQQTVFTSIIIGAGEGFSQVSESSFFLGH